MVSKRLILDSILYTVIQNECVSKIISNSFCNFIYPIADVCGNPDGFRVISYIIIDNICVDARAAIATLSVQSAFKIPDVLFVSQPVDGGKGLELDGWEILVMVQLDVVLVVRIRF